MKPRPTLADPGFEPTEEELQAMIGCLGDTKRPGLPELDPRLQAATRETLRDATPRIDA